jgi:Protein of unknown function (DUF3568)
MKDDSEIMTNKILSLLFLGLLLLAGCNAAINMNGKVAGISSGRFVYQDGNLTSKYKADIDLVWMACEKSVTELNATNIQKERKISTGTIKAIIQDENVVISVEYVDKDLTSVSVFVGMVGNNMASRLIHDRIISNLARNINP